jgi:heptosyltransferase II
VNEAPQPARVLVVQTSYLGDLVLATPVFAALARHWPDAHVTVLVRPEVASILEGHPDVDEVLILDKHGAHGGVWGTLRLVRTLRRGRFDVALSLHRSTRTGLVLALAEIPLRVGFQQSEVPWLYHRRVRRDPSLHDIDRQLSILDPLGVPHDGATDLPRLVVGPAARAAADALLAAEGIPPERSFVVVAPGSAWASKQWMPERFAEVAVALAARGETVVFVGTANEAATAQEIHDLAGGGVNLAGRTDAAGLAAIIGRATTVICNDSASVHVTQALAVPLVAIVGPTSEAQGFMPRGPRAVAVRDGTLTCRPLCHFGGDPCPLGTRACLHNVQTAQVLAALDAVRAGEDIGRADGARDAQEA